MPLSPTETALAILFSLLGALYILPPFWRAVSLLYLYTLRRPSLPSYVHSNGSYAFVTGASDGIGRALALELAKLGFNLILHGRNAEKLERVKQEVEKLEEGKEVRVWVQDAAVVDVDWEGARGTFEGLEVTVVVNNVGGSKIESESFDRQALAYVDGVVQTNALFPFHLTHTLLPQLRALNKPVLVLTVGSMAGVIPPPHFAAYAASKAFLQRFVHAMDMDERRVLHSKVRFQYLQTSSVVNSSGIIKRTDWGTPTAEAYAKGVVKVAGARGREVFPWWGHALQAWVVGLVGESVAEGMIIGAMEELRKKE